MKNRPWLELVKTSLVMVMITSIAAMAIAQDDIIDLKITKDTADSVEATIQNLSDSARKMNVDKMSISGVKVQNDRVTHVNWKSLNYNNQKVDLASEFQSRIIAGGKIETGDSFKAKGDYNVLTDAIQQFLATEQPVREIGMKKLAVASQSGSDSDYNSSAGNTSKLSTLSSLRDSASSISSSTATGDVAIPISVSCAPRVDYQLNKVFMQERTTVDGKETQSCKDTSTSYDLEKDYKACPSRTDVSAKKIIYSFQYFYIDADGGRNVVDDCKEDPNKTQSLKITTSYELCSDLVDIAARKAYSQYQQSYKDADGKDVITQSCSIDYDKSYTITEDFNSCSARHLFEDGYSISQSKLYYTKDSKQILVQDCQDTDNKYQHYTTNETCTPVVNGSNVTIFQRKYITVSGVRQYITDCSPLSSSVTIQSENCTATPYTHDFTAGQSFLNKNYFYRDLSNNRVDVSTCVKSEVSYVHQEDTSVCTAENDDTNLKTWLYSKKYILVDGIKKYISDCTKVATPITYREVGYKWSQEYNVSNASISVANSGDGQYLGSAQGEVVWYQSNCNSEYENKFLISSYSTTNKCKSFSSPSYNGNAIDSSMSNLSSITFDNYVENRSSAPLCKTRYAYMNVNTQTCLGSPATSCYSSNNTLYYQRCTNYKCSVYKFVKYPILQRNDGSKYTNQTRIIDTKYTCGNGSLNGVEVYY